MASTFSRQLREGYLQLVRSLQPDQRALVTCLRASLSKQSPGEEREATLEALVKAYRSGPRALWAPVLLDSLAWGLVASKRRLRRETPFMAEEDIGQHLVMALLAAAADMPLGGTCAYLDRRLLARANQVVRRSLERERRRIARQTSLDFLLDRDEAMAEWERWKSMIANHGN